MAFHAISARIEIDPNSGMDISHGTFMAAQAV